MVEGHAEGTELLLVPARAESRNEASAAQLVDRRDLPREDPGRMERRAGDERAERDPLRDACEPGERRPAVPRTALGTRVPAVEQVVADPDRIEAALLGSVRHRRELVAAYDPLHLGREFPNDADGIAECQVRWPNIPIVFCETRSLAEELGLPLPGRRPRRASTEAAAVERIGERQPFGRSQNRRPVPPRPRSETGLDKTASTSPTAVDPGLHPPSLGTVDTPARPLTSPPKMCLDGYRSAPGRSPV